MDTNKIQCKLEIEIKKKNRRNCNQYEPYSVVNKTFFSAWKNPLQLVREIQQALIRFFFCFCFCFFDFFLFFVFFVFFFAGRGSK